MEFSLWFDDEVDSLGTRLGEVSMQVLHAHGIQTSWQAVHNQSFAKHVSYCHHLNLISDCHTCMCVCVVCVCACMLCVCVCVCCTVYESSSLATTYNSTGHARRGWGVGPGRLCQHNFKHNRLSILVRIMLE